MHKTITSLLTIVLSPMLGATPASLQSSSAVPPNYHIEELGRSSWGLAIANDINNHGVVVGEWDSGSNFGDPRHAVSWANGQMTDITPDQGIGSASATAINDSGTVTGWYQTDGSYLSGGFRWSGGAYEVLSTFAPGHQKGYGISESGLILGTAMHPHFHTDGTLWDRNLNELDLGSLGQGTGIAYDANGWDVIAGVSGVTYAQTNAFIWRNGQIHDIGALPGYPIGRATAINNRNEVVGYSGTVLDDHAFYWSAATGMIDLGNLGHAYGSSAKDINESGVIVGYTHSSFGRVGAVWHDFTLYNLNGLLVNGHGWQVAEANGLNELGQIVGRGRRNGVSVAFLATPVNTPMTTVIGPSPGVAGALNDIEVVGASPGAEVHVYYGEASGSTPVPSCPGVSVDIHSPRHVVVHCDQAGQGCASIFLPNSVRNKRILFQGVDVTTCDSSNRIVRMID